jgi:hypothetical protein
MANSAPSGSGQGWRRRAVLTLIAGASIPAAGLVYGGAIVANGALRRPDIPQRPEEMPEVRWPALTDRLKPELIAHGVGPGSAHLEFARDFAEAKRLGATVADANFRLDAQRVPRVSHPQSTLMGPIEGLASSAVDDLGIERLSRVYALNPGLILMLDTKKITKAFGNERDAMWGMLEMLRGDPSIRLRTRPSFADPANVEEFVYYANREFPEFPGMKIILSRDAESLGDVKRNLADGRDAGANSISIQWDDIAAGGGADVMHTAYQFGLDPIVWNLKGAQVSPDGKLDWQRAVDLGARGLTLDLSADTRALVDTYTVGMSAAD